VDLLHNLLYNKFTTNGSNGVFTLYATRLIGFKLQGQCTGRRGQEQGQS